MSVEKDEIFEKKLQTMLKSAKKIFVPRFKKKPAIRSYKILSEYQHKLIPDTNPKNVLSLDRQFQNDRHECHILYPLLKQGDASVTYDFTVKEAMYHPSFISDYLIKYHITHENKKWHGAVYKIHQTQEYETEVNNNKHKLDPDIILFDEENLHKCLNLYAIALENNRCPLKLVPYLELDAVMTKAYRTVLRHWKEIDLIKMLNDVVSQYLVDFITRPISADYLCRYARDDFFITPFRKDMEVDERIYTVVCPFPVSETDFIYHYRNSDEDKFVTEIYFKEFRKNISKIMEYGLLELSKDKFFETIEYTKYVRRSVVKELEKRDAEANTDTSKNDCKEDN